MKFNTVEDRIAAIKAESIKLGEAYGLLKFQEAMMREVSQSYIDNKAPSDPVPTVTTTVMTETTAPEPEATVEEPKPKKKRASRKKKEEVKVEETEATPTEQEEQAQPEEPVVVQDVPQAEPEVEESTEQDTPDTEECTIKSVDDLRAFMTEKYKEIGGTPDAKNSIVNALETATGFKKAQDVTADKFEAAYTAIAAL